MKMRRILWAAAVLAVLLVLTACGGSPGGGYSAVNDETGAAYDYEMPMEAEESYYGGDMAYTSARSNSAVMPSPVPDPDEPVPPTEDPTGGAEGLPRKLIKRASLEMETTEFDETTAALDDLTAKLGGYYASAESGDRGGARRWTNYTVRVPSKNFERFLEQAGSICHELRRNVTQDDISERYYDIEGRKRTQETKLSRLQALLEQAENMEDIITIMSAISETEEQIEELAGTLSHYDSQVDYSTIELELSEVVRLSNVEIPPDTYGMRLSGAFTDGIRDFFEWIGDILVSLAYGWLWLVLLGGIAFGVYKLVHSEKWKARREAKKAAKEAKAAALREKWAGRYGGKKNQTPDGPVVNGTPVRTEDEKKD